MKKCISILLIIFLFINSGGFIVIFYHAQNSVKSGMLASIRKGNYNIDSVVKIKIRKNELYADINGFTWKEENEFEYNGMLYDIIKIEEYKENITLFCLSDLTESRIIKSFDDEINDLASGKINNSKYKSSLVNLISHALCLNPFKLNRPGHLQEYSLKTAFNLSSPFIEIPLPPPRSA